MLANFQIIIARRIEGGNLQQVNGCFNQLIAVCIDGLEQGCLNFIFLFILTYIDFAFLISILSATALMGLFTGLRFLINIFDRSLTIFPFQRLGLNGLIGAIEIFLEFKLRIGPCTDML